MNKAIVIENATKAAQCAELLLQDLQGLNASGDAMVSLLTLPEIEKVSQVILRLDSILYALSK